MERKTIASVGVELFAAACALGGLATGDAEVEVTRTPETSS